MTTCIEALSEVAAKKTAPQTSLFEAEAVVEIQRAVEHLRAAGTSLDAAAGPLAMLKREHLMRDLARVREFHRLVAVRLDVLARRVAEGDGQ